MAGRQTVDDLVSAVGSGLMWINSFDVARSNPCIAMKKSGAVIVIEDDEDDQFVLEEAFTRLKFPNKRIYFPDGHAALDYLNQQPRSIFLILSDINLPNLNGIELKAELRKNADIALKCVPYLYFTTAVNHRQVVEAYCESGQGFFIKPSSFGGIMDLLDLIIRYWTTSTEVEVDV